MPAAKPGPIRYIPGAVGGRLGGVEVYGAGRGLWPRLVLVAPGFMFTLRLGLSVRRRADDFKIDVIRQ
jgi:hypothetical protein